MKEYIIVWRSNHRDPFIQLDYKGFADKYATRAEAEKDAEATHNGKDFFDYEIYETSVD